MRLTFALAFLILIALPWAVRNEACAAPKPAAPNEAQQEEAVAVVRGLFKADFAAAKTPADKLELAKKLVQVAGDTKNDPVARFVLFRQVRDLAADGGDCDLMLEAIQELGADFELDVLKQKSEALAKFATATKSTTERKLTVRCLEALVAEAIAGDRYDLAKSNAATALAAARKASDLELVKSMSRKVNEVGETEAEYAKLKDSLATLEAKPADPAANLQVGAFRCYYKHDWSGGLPLLALGGDKALSDLAAAELRDNADPIIVADGWWKYAATQKDARALSVRQHAADWYRLAQPNLAGLARRRVEAILNQPELAADPSGATTAKIQVASADKNPATTAKVPSSDKPTRTVPGARAETGKWVTMYPAPDWRSKWIIAEGARDFITEENERLVLKAERHTIMQYPGEPKDIVIRGAVKIVRNDNMHVEIGGPDSHYSFIFNRANNCEIARNHESKYSSIKAASRPPGSEYEFQMAAIGNNLVLWVNGTKCVQVTDDVITARGKVNVGVWGRPGEVQFKKIEVLLPTAEQAKELLAGEK